MLPCVPARRLVPGGGHLGADGLVEDLLHVAIHLPQQAAAVGERAEAAHVHAHLAAGTLHQLECFDFCLSRILKGCPCITGLPEAAA